MYDGRSEKEIRESIADSLRSSDAFEEPALDEEDVIGALITAVSSAATNIEASLERVSQDASLLTATGDALTLKAKERGIERREATRATGVVVFSRRTAATTDYRIPANTRVRTQDGAVTFQTTEEVTLNEGDTSVSATAKATSGGTQGNLPPDKLTEMPSPPSGVESVTNPEPTGDEAYVDTSGQRLTRGLDRETDTSLRERALDAASIGGAASANSIATEIGSIASVISVTAQTNATATDNTGSDGLPPYSTEIVVYGGDTADIVERLADVMTIIDFQRLVGGVHGTKATYDVTSELLNETITGEITRPTRTEIDVSVDVVVTEKYAGDDVVKDTIVEYIGGFTTDNTQIRALGLGEDIVVDEVESRVTDVAGVRGITSLTLDRDGDGTDDTTIDSNGLSVLSVSDTEIVVTDAQDGSITVNTTQT